MAQRAPDAFGTDRTRRRCLGAVASLALGGCAFDADADHAGPDAPAESALDRPVRTAWVFSSGGPRGFVHVGVVKALSELGLRPDLVMGSSAGALIGVLCAAGIPAVEIESFAMDLQPLALARWAPGSPEGLNGSALRELVSARFGALRLQDLPTPAACVAVRLADRRVVAFTRGDAALAVQASSAIEGRLTPVRIRGERYADADRQMPLPVRLARALGAGRVLAVDASAHEDRAPPGAERFREGDRRKREATRPDAVAADLVLHPDFGYWVDLSADFRRRAIESGRRAALAESARLIALHAA